MNDRPKTRTVPLKARDYITFPKDPTLRTVNMTKLVDDAVEKLADIRYNGYGLGNQKRSRRVIYVSFTAILEKAGYTPQQASNTWFDQVRPIDDLNARAEG